MGRRRWNKKHPDRARAQQEQRKPEAAGDPPVRLIALQPNSSVVAVAIGIRVALVDYKTGEELRLAPPQPSASPSDPPPPPHAGCLRVLQFSPDGRYLLTGGDDKAARVWTTSASSPTSNLWPCGTAWRTPKKMSAGGFNRDGDHVLFADKFGDVLVGPVEQPAAPASNTAPAATGSPPVLAPGSLLGHFCSIVTGVAASPCGRFLATSDKEYKVRVSMLPADMSQISCEVQAYCLGHQDFVSCIAFAINRRQHQPQGPGDSTALDYVLVSGSGDGTVKVWDYVSGQQLSSYVASVPTVAAAGGPEGPGSGDAAVTRRVPGGGEASGVEDGGEEASGGGDDGDDEGGEGDEDAGEEGAACAGQAEGEGDGGGAGGGEVGEGEEPQRRSKAPPCAPVLSLAISEDGSTVAVVVEGDDEVQLLDLDWASRTLTLRQRLRWPDVRYPCQAAFGPGGQLWVVGGVPLPTARSVHIGVAVRGDDGTYRPCTEEVMSSRVRALLEARQEEEEAKMAEGGELYVYSKHLRKPTYNEDEVQGRKRMRNDHKETQRLAALRLRQDESARQKQQETQAEQ